MRIPIYIILAVCLVVFAPFYSNALDWPIKDANMKHHIGNSHGEFQFYGGLPYFHPGIDILAPAGTPVCAVKSGYVKAILTTSAELHWRVVIGDFGGEEECDGWLYAHLDESSITVEEGQRVEAGTIIGKLVEWPVAGFHHLHFAKVRHSGEVWDSNWQFIGNPLDELDPLHDSIAPVFENAIGEQLLAFSVNESEYYFNEGEALSGNVDIIARVYDYINDDNWKVAPYQIDYKIEGKASLPWMNVVNFTGKIEFDKNVEVIYKRDQLCPTRGNYDDRQFFHVITNTDGDNEIEESDAGFSWETDKFPDGQYTIYVRATDKAGNVTVASMDATVSNNYAGRNKARLEKPDTDILFSLDEFNAGPGAAASGKQGN
ncbi:MAG: peptidoglycan DD-metalloendopeptidase family protein [Candidatus Zixiibacteriota bacterium]